MTYRSPVEATYRARALYVRPGEVPTYRPRMGTAEMLARERMAQAQARIVEREEVRSSAPAVAGEGGA